jgi:hypothetical protein
VFVVPPAVEIQGAGAEVLDPSADYYAFSELFGRSGLSPPLHRMSSAFYFDSKGALHVIDLNADGRTRRRLRDLFAFAVAESSAVGAVQRTFVSGVPTLVVEEAPRLRVSALAWSVLAATLIVGLVASMVLFGV